MRNDDKTIPNEAATTSASLQIVPSESVSFQPSSDFRAWTERFLSHSRLVEVFQELLFSPKKPNDEEGPARGRRTMVTASRHREGTTSMALGMAAIAGQERPGRVLLLEANLRSPTLANILGCSPTPGLREFLQAKVELERVVQYVKGYGFGILPLGRERSANPKVFAAEVFRSLLRDLSLSFDHIIIDTAPIVSYIDSRQLRKLVDETVLVVGANQAPRQSVERARSLLTEAKVPVRLVLNRRRFSWSSP